MATRPRFAQRRRARPGSLERPVNGRMYRGTWLLVGIPLLAAAFTVSHPQPLRPPALPPTFDGGVAAQTAAVIAGRFPDRSPGSEGARAARAWVAEQFVALGFQPPQIDRFHAKIPGRGDKQLENLIVRRTGRTNTALVVLAHRDDTGAGPGANDNASGTAALLEVARAYAEPSSPPRPPDPNHTIVFVSTDGGAFGALGAERFARSPAWADGIAAVVNLSAIAGHASPRIEFAGDRSRSPAAALVRTAARRVLEQTGREPRHPSAFAQLVDLAFPFSLYEHAPFVGRGLPALTLTTAGPRPPPAFGDTDRLDAQRFDEIGRSAQALLASLDQEIELAQGTSSYIYLGARVIRGWALVFILCAALLPCLAAIVDLFARLRRRRIPLVPAWRSLRTRLAFWLFAGVLFELFALLGVWPQGAARPLALEDSPGTDWPLAGLVVFTCFLLVAWLVAREWLVRRQPVDLEAELAGYTTALLALGVISLLVVAMNPYALLFVLPSLHAWLWLPQARAASPMLRVVLLAVGLAGPALLIGSFAIRFELGFDAPWYVAQLAAVGYIPLAPVLVACAWLAVVSQLAALATGRYSPYPDIAPRRPWGPLHALLRRGT